jgi:hypothetical protein
MRFGDGARLRATQAGRMPLRGQPVAAPSEGRFSTEDLLYDRPVSRVKQARGTTESAPVTRKTPRVTHRTTGGGGPTNPWTHLWWGGRKCDSAFLEALVRTEAPRIRRIAAQICTAFPANATQCSQDTDFVSAYDFGRRRSAVVAGNFNARAERAARLRAPCLRLCVSSVYSSLLFTIAFPETDPRTTRTHLACACTSS